MMEIVASLGRWEGARCGNRERRCGEGSGESSYSEVTGSLGPLNVWSGQKTKWSPSKKSLATLSSQIIFPA